MNSNQFSLREALSFGFYTIKNNITLFLQSLVIFIVLFLSIEIVKSYKIANINVTLLLIKALFLTLYYLIYIGIFAGFIKMMLDLHDNKKVSIKTMFQHMYYVYYAPKLLIASLIYIAITRLGILAFILPGLLLTTRLFLNLYFIVDKNTSIYSAFRSSWRITKKVQWKLLPWVAFVLSTSLIEQIIATGQFIKFMFINTMQNPQILGILQAFVAYHNQSSQLGLSYYDLPTAIRLVAGILLVNFGIIVEVYIYRKLSNSTQSNLTN